MEPTSWHSPARRRGPSQDGRAGLGQGGFGRASATPESRVDHVDVASDVALQGEQQVVRCRLALLPCVAAPVDDNDAAQHGRGRGDRRTRPAQPGFDSIGRPGAVEAPMARAARNVELRDMPTAPRREPSLRSLSRSTFNRCTRGKIVGTAELREIEALGWVRSEPVRSRWGRPP